MKKIILILALALGVKVNAQIVGGYLPLNSTKTPTMGGLRVNGNEVVTGTFSVGSTATITGALNVGGGTNGFIAGNVSGQNRLYTSGNQFYFVNNGNGDAGLSAGTATFGGAIKAQSTMSLGSANLTGGNTGTVAVLSDALFSLNFGTGTGSPSDGATYYMGNVSYGFAATNSVIGTVRLPYNCTLVGWDYNTVVNGVIGSGESATISISGTTNYTLSTAITFSSASIYNNFSGSGLSQNFNAGDVINQKIICPTWATNPTNVMAGLTLWFVRRS